MEFWKKLSPAVLFLLPSLSALPLPASAAEDGKPFPVLGEQLNHRPPAGWKLTWMSGNAHGKYIVEYIPGAEDINSWRDGYLSIERLEYPPAVLKEFEHLEAIKATSLCGGNGQPGCPGATGPG